MPNSTSRPWRMLLPLAAVLLLGLLWTIYWFVASAMAQSRLSEERAALAARGIMLTCGEEGWGGYPFHFEFTCTAPMLTGPDTAMVGSSRLLLAALAYAPWQVVALVDGPSTLRAGSVQQVPANHQRIIAAITFGDGWTPKLSAEIPALSVPDHGSADKVMVHTRPSGDGAMDIAASATNVRIQRPGKPAIAVAEGELIANLSSDRTLRIERVALNQDAVRYWGSGTLALDEQNRPAGKLDTETNDLNGLLALVEPHLQLTEDKKAGLRTMLGLLGNEARAPLIAKDGVLYLGPFRISEIRPLY